MVAVGIPKRKFVWKMEVVENVINAKRLRTHAHVRIVKNAGGIIVRKSSLMQVWRWWRM